MRTLRYVALLSIAVAAFASDRPSDTQSSQFQPNVEWKLPIRATDGTFRFRSLPDVPRSQKIPREAGEQDLSGNVCYFIRSYVMTREDDTGATHLDHVTTCTPSSRFQSKKARVRVVPALAP
jgi:hypothetical protein